jgi:hypothetical protein
VNLRRDVRKQLHLARALKGDVEVQSGFDGLARDEQAVVLLNSRQGYIARR